ncbi:unnamed protein product [Symbiodinium sp. KB8]|nr:unnamed protein product [Symbiodinium sp. KB8]
MQMNVKDGMWESGDSVCQGDQKVAAEEQEDAWQCLNFATCGNSTSNRTTTHLCWWCGMEKRKQSNLQKKKAREELLEEADAPGQKRCHRRQDQKKDDKEKAPEVVEEPGDANQEREEGNATGRETFRHAAQQPSRCDMFGRDLWADTGLHSDGTHLSAAGMAEMAHALLRGTEWEPHLVVSDSTLCAVKKKA